MSKKRWMTVSIAAMGAASLFSDLGHEMVTAILPLFLTSIGASAAVLGLIEGSADAAASFIKLWSGWYSDRTGKRKPLTFIGYALTGIALATFGFFHYWYQVLIGRVVGWLGRGMRSPVRDAMLADAVSEDVYGKAFGFHRAMDTVGAFLGPLAALLLLKFISIRSIFLISLIPGLISAFAILIVKEKFRDRKETGLLASIAKAPPKFNLFLFGVGIFGLGNFSHTLLILRATEILSPGLGTASAGQIAILLYTLHNLLYALFAYPAGIIGDRIGRFKLLTAGYAFLGLMSIGFIYAKSLSVLILLFLIAGIYIAIVDTTEGSLAAELLPDENRGTGYGMLATVNGIGDFISSAALGFLWHHISPTAGFGVAAALSLLGAITVYLTTRTAQGAMRTKL